MPTLNSSNPRGIDARRLGRRPMGVKDHDIVGQLYPRITIDWLPDNIFVEIFDSYLVQDDRIDAWHTLVHVCRGWRRLVFTSPRRLNLRILCTPNRPIDITLNIWPTLPVVIDFAFVVYRPQGMANANIVAALQQHNRLYKINIRDMPNSLLEIFPAMEKPFPALTELKISSLDSRNLKVVSESFLAGSAPRLQSLCLVGIPFPTVGKLLLSTNDLFDLSLWKIPHSGYVSPEAMVSTLSALPKLKNLVLGFECPRSHGVRASLLPLHDTRVVLPALTTFDFKGDSEYLEDMVSRIDAPLLNSVKITFFIQRKFDTTLLRDFIGRTEMLRAPHRAEVDFYVSSVEVTLFREQGTLNDEILKLEISGGSSDWQLLSALTQLCNSIIRPLCTLERLGIYEYHDGRWYWEPDVENTQWLELLCAFIRVKDLVLSETLVRHVARALQELAGGRVPEVLPAPQTLFLEGPRPSESANEGIRKLIDACQRQLSGFPITIGFCE